MRKIGALFCLLFSFYAGQVFAKPLPTVCYNDATRILNRPLSSQFPEGEQFEYRFSLDPAWSPEIPLLIFVPGGPGGTSMTAGLSYPLNMMVVRTDPRGVGCNADPKLQSAHLSSVEIAKDIIAIIEKLKPKKYFIHGLSYGALVTTMVGSMIDESKVSLPNAVILEGTIGRPFLPDEYVKDVLLEWKRVRSLLPLEIQKILSESKSPLGLEADRWAAWLASVLTQGTLPSGQEYALSELLLLGQPEETLQILRNRILAMTKPPSEQKIRIYKEIACREFVPDVRDVAYDFDWVEGNLVVKDKRLCEGINFDRPFDSKKYQIKSPIIYFSGGRDTATPPAHVQYHFQNQTSARTLISVPLGGHLALSNNLSDCAEEFWKTLIADGIHQLDQAFSSCSLKDILIQTN